MKKNIVLLMGILCLIVNTFSNSAFANSNPNHKQMTAKIFFSGGLTVVAQGCRPAPIIVTLQKSQLGDEITATIVDPNGKVVYQTVTSTSILDFSRVRMTGDGYRLYIQSGTETIHVPI